MYINNVEVLRYNLDFHIQNDRPHDSTYTDNDHNDNNQLRDTQINPLASNVYECDNATSSFAFPRYVSATISHQYFRRGKNVIAVEVHRHVRKENVMFFSMTSMLLATSEYSYSTPYPFITASADVSSIESLIDIFLLSIYSFILFACPF